jgi:IK cytokine
VNQQLLVLTSLEHAKQKTSFCREAKEQVQQTADEDDENKVVFKSKLSRNIYRAAFRADPPKINELFLPRRMAYVIELDDDETDIPITLIRNRADCPNAEVRNPVLTHFVILTLKL